MPAFRARLATLATGALARAGYAAAGQLARAAAAILPASNGKLTGTFRARRGIRARYAQWGRTGRDPHAPLLWMHAPSVGEGLQARPVLQIIRGDRPDVQLAYSYFSPSASAFAGALDVDFRDFLPFDTTADARAALDALRPTALVFSKLDVWPILARTASERGVRLGLISATLPATSSRLRGLPAALLRDAYSRLDAVGAVDDADAERLHALGVRADVVEVTGDTRYDQAWARARSVEPHSPLLAPLRRSDVVTLVAGSTWPADERVLLEACRLAMAGAGLRLRLVIAPHEPTPSHLAPTERWAAESRLTLARLAAPDAGAADVVLVDRVGVLGEIYALADISYVGGGFHSAGLHSVLEPAAFGAPVLFGPRHSGSRDAALLLTAGGAAAASDVASIASVIIRWCAEPGERRAAGERARAVVEQGLGAAERSAKLVLRLLHR